MSTVLTKQYTEIMMILRAGAQPMRVSWIFNRSGLRSPAVVLSRLIELEALGEVKRSEDRQFWSEV